MCGQQQPIFRKVVEIYGDLQRFARLRWTLPSTQYVCVEQHRKYVGRPKSGLCTMIMRQWGNHLQFTILVIQFDDMISNTIWYKCPAEWSHLGSDVRHQRRRRLRTSSQGGKPTLLGRADAFFSPFVLRMLCLGGLAWYWVLGVGPTGYTESRQQPDELRRESWTRLPPAHGFLLRHTRKHWREKVSRNRNFRNIFPDSRGSNHYQYQILSFKWKD